MSSQQRKKYRFEQEKQWDTCLFAQTDRDSRGKGSVGPFAPYTRPGKLYASRDARSPVVTTAGEIVWFDGDHKMHRLSPCADGPETLTGSAGLEHASRIVATPSGLWVKTDGPRASIELYEDETFTRLLEVDLADAELIDITRDGGSIRALINQQGAWRAVRIDRAGHIRKTVDFSGIVDPKSFVFLPKSKRFVVFDGGPQPRLYWFPEKGGVPTFSRSITALRPCFSADLLTADSRDKVFLSGSDAAEFGGMPHVVIFDPGGNRIEDLPIEPLDSPVTGMATSADALVITGPRGLTRFDLTDVVPLNGEPAQSMAITPVLFSPDREDHRRWLRVEVTASLPEGSSLEISYGSTDKDTERNRLNDIAADTSIPGSRRVERLLSESDLWREPTVFQGSGNEQPAEKIFAAKLYDVSDRYLWICVKLNAAAGARLPFISRMDVIYPGRTLMENLPAIYQREERRPNSFLRGFVGVLETTTQGLEERIGSMGSQIDPSTADGEWSNFVARWLGVPWDDGLSPDQKRAVLKRAPDLAKGRGTRAGLEALLESLIPGTPRRFRVTDPTADFGFAVVGGSSCGSTLPAMLGGRTRWTSELGSNAVLGYMRLECSGEIEDGAWQLAGNVQIDVEATTSERKAWEPWLLTLITEMVPLTARVELRWVAPRSLRTHCLDGNMTLDPVPTAHVGTDAITNLARLPERGVRMSASGPIVGTRLR